MNRAFFVRSKLWDRIARWVITLGGFSIILSVIAIIFMIAKVALPLFSPARAELLAARPVPAGVPAGPLLAVGADDYMETGYVLDARGGFSFVDLKSGALLDRLAALPPTPRARTLAGVEPDGRGTLNLLWDDGSLSIERVQFAPAFSSEGKRTIGHKLERLKTIDAPTSGPRPLALLARLSDDGRLTRVAVLPEGRFAVSQQVTSTDLLGEATTEDHQFEFQAALPGAVSATALDQAGATLYAGTSNGYLLRWDLKEPGRATLLSQTKAFDDGRAITALALVLGDISLAVGDSRGGLSTWFPVARAHPTGTSELQRIHTLAAHAAPVLGILPSGRDKSLLSLDKSGALSLDHMTSERHLLKIKPDSPLALAMLTGRANGLIGLDAQRRLLTWQVDNPHPEVSWKTLFGKVWYESYPAPAYVWQSSSASDDFEPKLSLVPLLFGTLKGTLYALFFAVPLAVLGALYTSQFMRPELRRLVKPAVEVMAAIPSVVIGFLAALWLAPLVEKSLLSLLLCFLLVPLCLLLALLAWQGFERVALIRRLVWGHEFLALAPVVILAVALAWLWGAPLERQLFAGSFVQWLASHLGVSYDQRNCIIIAFALGFAVIPIIFTIADDALANVPRHLTAASLALGASRWQTAWRVVLPTASPGIFAGVMIGLGRAVGETMIVLMATGNTPIMDWSIFNGMRTLAANIAVEVPEAPLGGTLYRVLFLTAVLLFLLTFALNTLAEVVRQRLRRKYGQL